MIEQVARQGFDLSVTALAWSLAKLPFGSCSSACEFIRIVSFVLGVGHWATAELGAGGAIYP